MSIFNRVFEADLGQSGGQYYIIGRVKKVVLGPLINQKNQRQVNIGDNPLEIAIPDVDYKGPQDIGKIRYEIMYSTLTTSKSETASEPAFPIYGFLKQYPVIGELVLIIPGPTYKLNERSSKKQFFYFPPYSTWGNVNHGVFPNLSELSDFLSNYDNKPGYSGQASFTPKFPMGNTFKEKLVRTIKPFEGDSVIQARFGQSIRFGSTVPSQKKQNTWSNQGENGDPITIIINEQKKLATSGLDQFDPFVENVNRDGSSIWLTSTQEIVITNLSRFPLNSFGLNISPINEVVVQIERPPLTTDFINANAQDKFNASVYTTNNDNRVENPVSTTENISSFQYTTRGKKFSSQKSYKIEVEVINNQSNAVITVQGSSSLISLQDAYSKVIKLLNDYKAAQNIAFENPSLNSLSTSSTNF